MAQEDPDCILNMRKRQRERERERESDQFGLCGGSEGGSHTTQMDIAWHKKIEISLSISGAAQRRFRESESERLASEKLSLGMGPVQGL